MSSERADWIVVAAWNCSANLAARRLDELRLLTRRLGERIRLIVWYPIVRQPLADEGVRLAEQEERLVDYPNTHPEWRARRSYTIPRSSEVATAMAFLDRDGSPIFSSFHVARRAVLIELYVAVDRRDAASLRRELSRGSGYRLNYAVPQHYTYNSIIASTYNLWTARFFKPPPVAGERCVRWHMDNFAQTLVSGEHGAQMLVQQLPPSATLSPSAALARMDELRPTAQGA